MPKYKDSPEERAANELMKKQIQEVLTNFNVNDLSDLHKLLRKRVGTILENGLEAELDEELGYSKYDYKNKTGTNSRNGHSKKTMKTSFGEMELAIPRDREGEFEPQLVKSSRLLLPAILRKRYFRCTPRV